MFLHFLDDLLLQDLSLEPAKGILYRLALLKSNLCQIYKPPTSAAILRLDQSPVLFNCHADDPTSHKGEFRAFVRPEPSSSRAARSLAPEAVNEIQSPSEIEPLMGSSPALLDFAYGDVAF